MGFTSQIIPIANAPNPNTIAYFPKLVSVKRLAYFAKTASITAYEPKTFPKITRIAEAEKNMTIILITLAMSLAAK
jgi:hypothetical protein